MSKPTVYITKGLPGSGKSTWARERVEGSYSAGNRKTKRVNKDELRAMLDNGHHSKANEAMVLEVRDFLVIEAIQAGCNIIVDDTNLSPHRALLAGIRRTVPDDGQRAVEIADDGVGQVDTVSRRVDALGVCATLQVLVVHPLDDLLTYAVGPLQVPRDALLHRHIEELFPDNNISP